MTRKNYNALANAIAVERSVQNYYTAEATEAAVNAIDDVARAIAKVCADDNGRFDTDRFLIACGVPRDS